MRDILDVCAALHVHRALVIGTSFGGLMAMGLAAARPSLVRAVVLNDIGPDVGTEGAAFVREFVGLDPALPTVESCIDLLRSKLPPLSLQTEDDWRAMTELTYRRGPDRLFHPLWDVRLAATMDETVRDLWPLWGALAHAPVLLVRGGVSNILLPETVARMQAERPDMHIVTVPDVGHAPILTEPPALAALRSFVEAYA
jgi:pimeloyl-ACP methyl ester carboxylesterase